MEQTSTSPEPERRGAAAGWRLAALGGGLAALFIAARWFDLGGRLDELRAGIVNLGAWGPILYVLIYAAATTLAFPASLLTIAAGAMFGSVVGVAVVIAGATLGATLAFIIARWLARDAVVHWLGAKPSFRRLDAMTERHGALFVAITRLVPLFPFTLLNYGFGLTRVPLGIYVLWSFVCMVPGTILYVVGADVVARTATAGRLPWPLVAAFLAVAALLFVLVRRARRLLAEREAGTAEKS